MNLKELIACSQPQLAGLVCDGKLGDFSSNINNHLARLTLFEKDEERTRRTEAVYTADKPARTSSRQSMHDKDRCKQQDLLCSALLL